MFGLGFWEIAIILGVALIVLGPSKLPELARGLGKGLREFRKATEDFKSTIEDEMYKPEAAHPPPRPAVPPSVQIDEPALIPPPPAPADTVLPPPVADPLAESAKPAGEAVAPAPLETEGTDRGPA